MTGAISNPLVYDERRLKVRYVRSTSSEAIAAKAAAGYHRRGRRRTAPDVGLAALEVRRARHLDQLRGAGTMGFGVPPAIGAKVGRPDRTVWCIDGDGCFQMTAQELTTARSEGIPIKVAILNNAYLGWCASGKRCSTRSVTPRST